MSTNQRKSLNLSYSCAAAFSVWIPKPLQDRQTDGKIPREELRQIHLKKGFWSSDSLFYKDIGSSKMNRV
jgi:hypothetical protein